MSASSWGPFRPSLDPAEKMAQLRTLRLAVKLLCGPRAAEVCHLLLVAEISLDDDTLADAQAEFDRLAPLDRRRVQSSFQSVLL